MSYSEQLLLSIITSGVTTIIIIILFKKFIGSYVEYLFHKKELMHDSQIEMERSVDEAVFNKELAIYPEVVELIYRSRNAARDCLNEEKRNMDAISVLSACKIHLTNNIYNYRIFFSEKIFRELHRFKIEIQEFAVLLDEITRSPNVEDSPVNPEIRKIAKKQLDERYNNINKLHEMLIPEIQEQVTRKKRKSND